MMGVAGFFTMSTHRRHPPNKRRPAHGSRNRRSDAALMMCEDERRKSFTEYWPHRSHLPAGRMALAGLFYTGESDRVTCPFCLVQLTEWEPNDDPKKEHRDKMPNCSFVIGKPCGDKPLPPELRSYTDARPARENIVDACPPKVPAEQPVHPRYQDQMVRLSSFKKWPHSGKTPDELFRAGFFFTGETDTVRCYSCDGELMTWNTNDDPWKEHARWFPHCRFLIKTKGPFYISQVQDDATAKETKEELLQYGRARGHSDYEIDGALENGGVIFESRRAMMNAVLALEGPPKGPTGAIAQAADEPSTGK